MIVASSAAAPRFGGTRRASPAKSPGRSAAFASPTKSPGRSAAFASPTKSPGRSAAFASPTKSPAKSPARSRGPILRGPTTPTRALNVVLDEQITSSPPRGLAALASSLRARGGITPLDGFGSPPRGRGSGGRGSGGRVRTAGAPTAATARRAARASPRVPTELSSILGANLGHVASMLHSWGIDTSKPISRAAFERAVYSLGLGISHSELAPIYMVRSRPRYRLVSRV